MIRLDEILRTKDNHPDYVWSCRVFRAILRSLITRHGDQMYLDQFTPSQIMLSDTFDDDDQLQIVLPDETEDIYAICYTAPERSRSKASVQSDIFSAAAIFYRMLTGHAPWSEACDHVSGSRQRQILLKWKRKTPLTDIDTFPQKVQHILRAGLALNPGDRYTEVGTMLYDIVDDPDEEPIWQLPKAAYTPEPNRKVTDSVGASASETHFAFHKGNGNGFQDIAGMDELKSMLQDDVLFVLRNREQAQRYRLDIPNGMLLYGPPGCGKTYLAEKFAEEAGTNFIVVQASDLGSSYVHGTQEKISQLFKQAKRHAPVVVCLDEFDAMAPDRSSRAGDITANEVNEFLTCLNNCSHDGIFVIALTNRPDKLDPALLRSGRFDKKIYVPLPDQQARKEIFSIHLKGRPCDADQLDLDKLSSLSDGYVGSDIAMIVSDAARKAARANQPISEQLLEDTLHANPPSVKPDTLRYYDQIRIKMEQGADARPMIGFR